MRNPIRWIRERFARQTAIVVDVINPWQAGRPLASEFDIGSFVNDGYKRNVLIFACVSEIATSISEPPLCAYQTDRKGERVELPPEHELTRLLARPNLKESKQAFIEKAITCLKVAGNSYIFKVRNGADVPVELRVLRPDLTEVVPDNQGGVESYSFGNPGAKKRLNPEDVIHLMAHPDPLQPWYGVSPISVLARFGDIDNAAADYIRSFFFNAGAPSAYLKFKTKVRPEERDRIRTLWHEQYSGEKGWHRLGVLDADVDYTKIGAFLEELQLDHVFGQTETRICAVYGVPPIIVGAWIGLLRSTYANYSWARKSFWSETLVPQITKIDQQLTSELASEFGRGIVIEHDLADVEALQEEKGEVRKFALESWNSGLATRNEARGMVGLDAAEDGDVFKMNATDVIDNAQLGGEYEPLALAEPKERLLLTEGEDFAARPDYKALHRLADALAPKLESKLKKAVASAQKATRVGALAEAIAARDRHKAERIVAWDRIGESREEIAAGLKKLFMDSARTAVHIARAKPGIKLSAEMHDAEPAAPDADAGISFDLINEAALQYAEEHAAQLVTLFADKAAIRDIITRAFEEGIPPAQAARLIREHIGLTPRLATAVENFRSKLAEGGIAADAIERKAERYAQKLLNYRARMIARSETIQASNSGQRALWEQGVADGLIRPDLYEQVWITAGYKVCPQCSPLEGARAPIGGQFSTSVGMVDGPALHPACRCATGLALIETQAAPKPKENTEAHDWLTAADLKRIIAEIPAPVIHVEASAIPAPVINVPQPVVNVEIRQSAGVVRTVERDEQGLIKTITEKPAETT